MNPHKNSWLERVRYQLTLSAIDNNNTTLVCLPQSGNQICASRGGVSGTVGLKYYSLNWRSEECADSRLGDAREKSQAGNVCVHSLVCPESRQRSRSNDL